jgi:hypothetical protein
MPFPLIPTALGLCFLLVWIIIGGMILREGQVAADRERESPRSVMPLGRRPRRQAA